MKKIVFTLLNAVMVMMFVVLVGVVFAQVIFRYVLHISVPWTEELARVILVWLVFLGISEVERKKDGIRTTYFIEKLPKCFYKGILVASNLAAISLMACLFWGAVCQIRTNSVYFLSSMPFLSRTVFYYPILVGAPLSIWMLAEQILEFIKSPIPFSEETAREGGEET